MKYDAVIVGSGPNGLSAAITLLRAQRSVLIVEAQDDIGGGARTAELTLPGFHHDVCSAVHPFGGLSPFLTELREPLGIELVDPDIPLAHPIDDGRAGVLVPELPKMLESAGPDARVYKKVVGHTASVLPKLAPHVLGPAVRVPHHPVALARFGLMGILPAQAVINRFTQPEFAGLFAGAAAHSFLPLSRPFTTTFGSILLACGHTSGWPIVRGGSGQLTHKMAEYVRELGGEIHTGHPVRSLRDIPDARTVLFDLTPRQVLNIAGDEFPHRYQRALTRFKYGSAAFKLDYALSEPVPWTNDQCRRAGTVHVGGTAREIAQAMTDIEKGKMPERPFVLIAQPTLYDRSRAPEGRHTLWVYAHVPRGSTDDATQSIEDQIERFAPGFRDTVLAKHVSSPQWLEQHNENYVGGDISGGSMAGMQLLFRPTKTLRPYRTPNPRFFFCSASTPPGPGVHFMCGAHAARTALKTTLS